jgi:EpsD family peptidyl-prolyl cis-trans isomerase
MTISLPARPIAADEDSPAAELDGVVITQRQVDGTLANARLATQKEKQAALDRIVSQELMAGQARREELDKAPAVVAAIASAKRQILAQAFLEKRANDIKKPTLAMNRAYYDEHPALFSARAIYELQAITIQADGNQLAAVNDRYKQIETLDDMADWLSAQGIPHASNVAATPAEDLPGDLLGPVSSLQQGQVIKVSTDFGVTIFQLIGKRAEPMTFAEAEPVIEAALFNQALGEHMRKAMLELRSKATIEYFPPYAPAN